MDMCRRAAIKLGCQGGMSELRMSELPKFMGCYGGMSEHPPVHRITAVLSF